MFERGADIAQVKQRERGRSVVPAHIGIKDLMGSGFALATQFLPEAGRRVVGQAGLGRGAVWRSWSTTTKGRELVKEVNGGHSYGGYVTPDGAAALLEKGRSHREIHCADYQSYRQELDKIRSDSADHVVWPKEGGDYVDAAIKLVTSKGYDEKGHDHWKEEWQLYLKRGTEFDATVQGLFNQGWSMVLIKGRDKRIGQLKRIEATTNNKTSSGSKLVILWTST